MIRQWRRDGYVYQFYVTKIPFIQHERLVLVDPLHVRNYTKKYLHRYERLVDDLHVPV